MLSHWVYIYTRTVFIIIFFFSNHRFLAFPLPFSMGVYALVHVRSGVCVFLLVVVEIAIILSLSFFYFVTIYFLCTRISIALCSSRICKVRVCHTFHSFIYFLFFSVFTLQCSFQFPMSNDLNDKLVVCVCDLFFFF